MSNILIRKNFVYSILEKCLRAGLVFVSLGVVGRYLGPEEYGQLSYFLVLVTYFQLLGAFGQEHNLVRIFSNKELDRNEVFWSSTVFKTWMSLFSIFLYGIFIYINGKGTILGYFFGITIFYAVLDNSRLILEALNYHHVVAKYEIGYQFTSALSKILIVSMGLSVEILVFIFILDFIIPRLLLTLFLKSLIKPPNSLSISKNEYLFYFKSGLFYCLNSLLVIVYMKVDQLLIGNILGMNALGNYAAAVRISDAWYFIPVTISAVFYPLALSEDANQRNRNIQTIFDLITLASLFIIIPAIFFGDEVFALLFGQKFSVDISVLNLLFYSGFFISLNVATAAWLNVKNLSSILFARALLGAVLNIVLNIYFLPRYGIIGGAFASLISYAATVVLTLALPQSSECRVFFWKSLNLLKSGERILRLIRD